MGKKRKNTTYYLVKRARKILIQKGAEPGRLGGIGSCVRWIKHIRPDLADLKSVDCLSAFLGDVVETKNKSNVEKKRVCAPTDSFLQSYEWRRLRYKALIMCGAKCQCCGASPETGAVLNVDHIKPRKLFPSLALDINNLQVLCGDCNHGKGNWDMTDWRNTNRRKDSDSNGYEDTPSDNRKSIV